MKQFYSLALLITIVLGLLHSGPVFSQCPSCTPDETCFSGDGLPAVCPITPPDATAGVYYEQQMTFYMPATIIDPGTGSEVTLLDVSIASVTGLPYGLEFTLNDDDGVFHPSDGENYGCATICGVPLIAGSYDVIITVNALVSVLIFELTQTQSFASVMTVIPGEGSANSFAFDNFAGCGSVDVNFEALISVPAPSVTTYTWDFDNGETGSGAVPPTVSYSSPGTYSPSLTTVISDYSIDAVSLSSLGGDWDDLEEFLTDADPFFTIYDANNNAVFTSGIVDNSSVANWLNLNLTLAAPPYSIQFFDDDQFNDDALGVTNIAITEGLNFFDIGDGTTGSFMISLSTTNEFTDSTTISVFDIPDASLTQNGNVLSLTDQSADNVIWYVNGSAIDGEFSPSLTLTEGGLYSAEVTNEFGCSSMSESILFCAPVTVTFDANAVELSVEDIYESYQWSYNGLPLDGETTYYCSTTDPGNYSVTVTTDYGCEITSNVYTYEVSVDEVSENGISVYPNPASDILYFSGINSFGNGTVAIFDILGKNVLTSSINAGFINVSALQPGVYFAVAEGRRVRWIKK